MYKKNKYVYLFFVVTSLLITAVSHAGKFDRNTEKRIIVFGDSVVDIGNLPPLLFLTPAGTPGLIIPPPTRYDRGRFSNGPNVVDYLARKLGVYIKPSNTGFEASDSVNFAHGGSTTYMSNLTPGGFPVPGVLGQVGQFLSSDANMVIDPQTIIMIFSGGNDYIFGIIQPEGIPPVNPATTMGNIKTSISQLYDRGARRFVVFNLPDLGKIPLCMTFNICSSLSDITTEHNKLYEDAIKDLEGEHRNILIANIDLYALFDKVIKSPEKYGFEGDWQNGGPASGCILQDPQQFNPVNCNLLDTFSTKLFFWDEFHPTTGVHELMAEYTWKVIRKKLLWSR